MDKSDMNTNKGEHSTVSPRITTDSPVAMVDTTLEISVSGLKPYQKITVIGCIEERNVVCISHAHFIADASGYVNLKSHPSLGGTYTGVDSTGIIWSMVYCIKGTRLIKRNANSPYILSLSVLNGFQRIENKENKQDVLCETCIERWYLSSDTQRIPIRQGRIRGTLFTPKGDLKRPGIIDMFGSFGGILEYRAALLASYGYSALALAYVAYDDLPPTMDFDYEYFDEAVEVLLNHSSVNDSLGLGVIGVSKGAEIALHMASYNPEIRACISINVSSFYLYGSNTYKGKSLNVYTPGPRDVELTDDGMTWIKQNALLAETKHIPVRQSKSSFLLLQGTGDIAVDYNQTLEIANRIRYSGNDKCAVRFYPGAGHLLEPPFMPLCRSVYHKQYGAAWAYGGEPRLHALAQSQAWEDILNFLHNTFNSPSYTRVGRLPNSQL